MICIRHAAFPQGITRRDSMILFCTANQQTTRRKEKKKINNLPYKKSSRVNRQLLRVYRERILLE